MFGKQGTFILFAFTLISALILPACFQHGMFMDGIQYAVVSENLAEGKGSFWYPYLSSSWNKMGENAFLEHPPLSYALQAGFFKLLGEGFYVEKIYGLFMCFLCICFIYGIWKIFFKQQSAYSNYWWLAAALWFITPSVCWSFKNNMIENTVSVFALASSFFCLKALCQDKNRLLFLILSGFCVFAGSLSKGIPALFPIALVLCYHFSIQKISLQKLLGYTLTLILIPAILYAIIISTNEEAKNSLAFYLKSRLLERINSEHIVDNRFSVLWWLVTDEFVDLGVLLLMTLLFKWKSFKGQLNSDNKKILWFFFIYGLSGVVPLCSTHVQRAVYFIPALPFFSIALTVFLAGHLNELIKKLDDKVFRIFRTIVFIGAITVLIITFLLAGTDSRDEEILHDVRMIGASIGKGRQISTDETTYLDWDFQFYLLRYYDDTLIGGYKNNEIFIIHRKSASDPIPEGFEELKLNLNKYRLFKKLN
ncbi:MAG: glycosyltransferase family 39 protein [Bacteroidia bacterium]|nr:glycosyltransferase family 39 protein [Bacteroidia bacterium]